MNNPQSKRLWHRISFSGRVFLSTVMALLVAMAVTMYLGAREDIATAKNDILKQASHHQAVLPLMIKEAAILGDYAAVKQILEQYGSGDGVAEIIFSDSHGAAFAVSYPSPIRTPEWFSKWTGIANEQVRAKVTAGNQRYGELSITVSGAPAINFLWKHLAQHMYLLATAFGIEFLAIWVILWFGLRPLEDLSAAAAIVAGGNLTPTLKRRGPPEFLRLIDAFNEMLMSIREGNQAVAVERDRFKALTALSADWFWEQDEFYRFVRMSAGVEVTGYPPDFFLGKTRWELPLQISESDMSDHLAKVKAHEHFRNLEYRLIGPSGEIHWHSISGEPVIAPSGEFLGYRGVGRDITHMKQAMERLGLAASVFEYAHEGITITDANGTIVDVNPTFETVTGYTRAEVLGKTPAMLKSGRQGPDFYQGMWAALKKVGHWRGEVWNRRKDGETYIEMLTISAVKNARGEPTHYVGVFSDITAMKEHQQHLERVASQDALTQLPNRSSLHERMDISLAAAKRNGTMLAVCYIDLDGFKPINDIMGHETGDRLLIEVANRLKADVRGGDTVARLGGDEFVVLLTGVESVSECERALTRLLAGIAHPYTTADGQPLSITASIGATVFPTDDGDADALLRHADQAMYLAKQAGQGRFQLFDPSKDREVVARREAITRIRHALDARELLLFYQPKVNMRTGAVVGFEALIRWQHPERGLLPPIEFLPVMEGTAVAVDIGFWVIEEALRQLKVWKAIGISLPVSVNIPGKLLLHDNFVEFVHKALQRYPEVSASLLEMEILESVALEDVVHASKTIDECRKIGVTFALDDFGTGYSSLTYFKRLAVDSLKIDQSFIRHMTHDQEDLAIVEGVIGLTEAFERHVVAEGVETVAHGTMLLHLGCEVGQGYGIARPMAAKDVPGWLTAWKPFPEWADAANYRWAHEDIPLLGAEVSHRQWVEAIARRIQEPDAAHDPIALDADKCRFGKWYHSSAANRYRSHPRFRDLDRMHVEMHVLGAQILNLLESGFGERAGQLLSALYRHRDAIVSALHELAGHGNAKAAADSSTAAANPSAVATRLAL